MKKFWGLTLIALFLVGCHTSKRPVLYGLMEEESPVNLATLQRQYPDDAGVYLFYKHDIANDLKPDFKNNAPRWYFFESYHWREMRLEDTPGDEQELFQIPLASYEKIRDLTYKVIQPDGITFGYKKSALKRDRMGGDSSLFRIVVEGIPAGSIVEAAYEIERGDLYKRLPLSHDVAFQLDKPALDMAFAYTYPRDWDVQVKQIGEQRDLFLSESADDKAETKTLHYRASKVPAFASQPFGPYLKEVAPYFHVQVLDMEVGNVLAYEAPDAWETIARSYAVHARTPGRKVKAGIDKAFRDLALDEHASDQMKIDAILTHVRADITPHPRRGLEDVVKNGKGNPYAIATYAQALMDRAGIVSNYLVAHSAQGGNFDAEFVSGEQLYHPVLEAEVAGQQVYLFPALDHVPAAYVPSVFEEQPALRYVEGDFEGFTTISQANAASYADNNAYDVFINADGDARVEATLEMGHHAAYQFFHGLAREDEGHMVKTLLPHSDTQVDELTYNIAPGSWDNPTRVEVTYALDDCVAQEDETVVFESCGLFDAMHNGTVLTRAPRRLGSASGETMVLKNTVAISYPAAWTLLTDVQEAAETVIGGRFTRKVKTQPGFLQVDQALALERNAVQPLQVASNDVIRLPARAALPMLEMTTMPIFTDAGEGVEVEPGGPWTLVIQTFASVEEAEQEASKYREELAEKGFDINVLMDGSEANAYRLVLGTFATRTGIESARETLGEALPFDAWMLSLKPQMTAVTGKPGPVMQ
ncbi:MAG: SPOR domain-containing protein [Bacteroidota bacterium]